MGDRGSQSKLGCSKCDPPLEEEVPGLGALVNLATFHLGATHPTANPFGPSAHHGSFLPTGHLTGK